MAMALGDGAAATEAPVRRTALRDYQCALQVPEPVAQVRFGARRRRLGNNFSKGAKWSPDGAVALTAHDDSVFRLHRVTEEVLRPATPDDSGGAPNEAEALAPYAEVDEGAPLLDFCFFPAFSWEQPATCCFIASSQDHPIHLRDALKGELRNTYRPFNQADEVCSAFSLCFSADGGRILAGFQNCVRVWDLQRPGRQVADWLLSTRKGKGQKGIIGALASSPYYAMYAAGSYNGTVCAYAEGQSKPLAWLQDPDPAHKMGGVTQLAWASDWLLLSGHRRDGWIRAWDLRQLGSGGGGALLHRFQRSAGTHQRFHFSTQGDTLSTGDDSGSLLFYSLAGLEPVGQIQGAHGRPCVSAMLHPTADAVLSSSGARTFPNHDVDSPCSSPRFCSPREASPSPPDNSTRIWRLGWDLAS